MSEKDARPGAGVTAPGHEPMPSVFDDVRLGASTPVIRRAVALLDATFEALVDPERWCDEAWARDAAGATISGTILEAIESPQAASRCLLGELVHQGLRRRYRIGFIASGLNAVELCRAPASFWLAAEALAEVAAEVLTESEPPIHSAFAELPSAFSGPRGRRVLLSVELNEECSYEPIISTVVLLSLIHI